MSDSDGERLARIETALSGQKECLDRIAGHMDESRTRHGIHTERLVKLETTLGGQTKVGWMLIAGMLGLMFDKIKGVFS